MDLTKLATKGHLIVGLSTDGVGAGVTGVTFDLFEDGKDVIHKAFTTAAAATAYFTNDAIDLGALAGRPSP